VGGLAGSVSSHAWSPSRAAHALACSALASEWVDSCQRNRQQAARQLGISPLHTMAKNGVRDKPRAVRERKSISSPRGHASSKNAARTQATLSNLSDGILGESDKASELGQTSGFIRRTTEDWLIFRCFAAALVLPKRSTASITSSRSKRAVRALRSEPAS
jgi:hypothetical protein